MGGFEGPLCVISYNVMQIHNYFKIEKILKACCWGSDLLDLGCGLCLRVLKSLQVFSRAARTENCYSEVEMLAEKVKQRLRNNLYLLCAKGLMNTC